MGYGDPYHKHPLTLFDSPSGNCFHCEFPISDNLCYGCEDCDYYIHMWCHDLPIKLKHPLHDQHLLTLFEPPKSSSSNSPIFLCNECQNPCLGRFSYHCTTCQLFFHLKCLFTLKLEKHDHPLIFSEVDYESCKVCGSFVFGLGFGCRSCKYYIHHECSVILQTIKGHHVHELTLRHNFPEECDQVYCDLCEDRDGEMDRDLSYYYCKRCDYIAHVNCCITQPREDVLLFQRFTHEHPLRPKTSNSLLCCSQCPYVVSDDIIEYPSLIKHPRHSQHILVFDQEACGHFNCTECDFSMEEYEVIKLNHPLWRYDLRFNCKNSLFWCNACGELGKGSRVEYTEGKFDLHLECFALPGKLEHQSHEHHPLYLRWLDESTSRYCSVCTKEMDPQLWFYFCQDCNFSTHMVCVARDLLSTLQSSIKNLPDFCAIIEPDESSFKFRIADMKPSKLNISLPSFSFFPPMLEAVGDDDEENYDLGSETFDSVLACPKCRSLVPTQAVYSDIKGWKSGFLKDSIAIANNQMPSKSEPLSFLDEQIIDDLCCSICNMLIFPPTHSCASCQIFFHKSCAELPRKILLRGATYVLTAPPFPEGLSNCSYCKYPISSLAYLSAVDGIIFDVRCASGTPLFNPAYHNHGLCFSRAHTDSRCLACKNNMEKGTVVLRCNDCINFELHPECGLLPPVIKHRIHWHPLELATDLAELYDEYICDVCEKDLNPNLWAYRCVDECGIRATSHASCIITSKKKCHFNYDDECQNMTEEEKLEFQKKAKERGIRL